MTVAVHGFGRIGRSAVKAAIRDGLWAPAAITDVKDPATLGALFEFDTNYGRWTTPVSVDGSTVVIGEHRARFCDVTDGIPDWGAMGVDLVVDCSGRATSREGAQAHLDRGAKRVLVSAPSSSLDDCDAVLLRGINAGEYDKQRHRIVSMASCTTNALAPVIKVLHERFGIEHGFFSSVHAYTNSQSVADQPMRDRRNSWAAAENIIPSTSGAAKALAYIWPGLAVTGKAYRVPVRTGSIVEFNANLRSNVNAADVAQAFRDAADNPPLKGVLGVLEEEYASARIVGETHSSIIDLPLTSVIGGRLVSVAAWYDNEMGYATRLAEMAAQLAVP